MTAPFPNRPRADAREKVMGAARYGADHQVAGLLYAMQVPATIAKGRIASLSVDAAMQVPGVIRVLTATDFLPPPPATPGAPPPPATLTADIAYRGQPVALVVAETLEAAIEGAEAIHPTYTTAPAFTSLIEQPGVVREAVKPVTAGDATRAMARAVTRHKADYVSPPQHHNPIEMLSTTAVWENGQLTIYESTQSSSNTKGAVMRNMRLTPEQATVKSPQIGGGFGQRGGAQRQTALVARAAMLLGRPVKLVLPRGQIFHNATFRPKNRHRIEIGADASGKMIAVRYDADQQQSREGSSRLITTSPFPCCTASRITTGPPPICGSIRKRQVICARRRRIRRALPSKARWTNLPSSSASIRSPSDCATAPRPTQSTVINSRPAICRNA